MQRGTAVGHLTSEMEDQLLNPGVQDAEAYEAAIRRALAATAPMPRDPVRTRILQASGSAVALLAALQFATAPRGGHRA